MNKTRRVLVILLAILVVISFAGCNQRESIDANKSDSIEGSNFTDTSSENESEETDKTDGTNEHILKNEDNIDNNKNEGLIDSVNGLLNIIDFDSLKINPNYKVSLISEYDNAHRRYYSPDKKNYIRVEFTYVEEYYERHLYLNDSLEKLGDIIFESYRPVYWISNSRFLLDGTTIYDINDATTTQISTDNFYADKDYGDIFSSSFKLCYSVNSTGTKIAYSFCDYVGEDDFEMYHIVGIYDINSAEYQEVARDRLTSIYFNNNCFWDESNNLYYNYDKKGYWYVAKHNISTNEKKILNQNITNGIVRATSPNLRYIVVSNSDYSLYDTFEDKILYTTSAYRWYLGDDGALLSLDYDKSKISIFSCADEEEVIISGFNERLVDNNIEVMFNYVDNYYTVCFYQIQPEDYDLKGPIFKIEKE